MVFDSSIRCSRYFLLSDILPLRYFSITRDPIGTPYVAPKPAFSTYTHTAMRGLSYGAKPINAEWSLPCGFCAVPVLPATSMSGRFASEQVPPSTAIRIPSATSLKYVWFIVGNRLAISS